MTTIDRLEILHMTGQAGGAARLEYRTGTRPLKEGVCVAVEDYENRVYVRVVLDKRDGGKLVEKLDEFINTNPRNISNIKRLKIHGNSGADMVLGYSNEGEPFRDGATIEVQNEKPYFHVRVMLHQADVKRFRDKVGRILDD